MSRNDYLKTLVEREVSDSAVHQLYDRFLQTMESVVLTQSRFELTLQKYIDSNAELVLELLSLSGETE